MKKNQFGTHEQIETLSAKAQKKIEIVKDPLILALIKRYGDNGNIEIPFDELDSMEGYALAMRNDETSFYFKLMKQVH